MYPIAKNIIFIGALIFMVAACAPATQNIPVSTAPAGASVLADGELICTSPCNVPLVRTQPHILTFQKEGYQQADVQIKQVYDTAAVARGAVQAGTGVGSRGAGTDAAISNALLNTQAMEDQGTAYVLSPSSVVIQLVPNRPAHSATHPPQPIQTSQAEQPIVINSDQLAPADQKRLQDGQQSPVIISSDQLAPENNTAKIQTTEPATMGSAVADDPMKAAEAALEAGAAAAPTVGTKKSWGSSHSSESFSNDGSSYTKSTSSTKTSVGVSVNPAEAGLGLLHLLEGTNNNSESTSNESE